MSASTEKQGRTPQWAVVAISVFFGLFYAYALWNAVAYLVAQASGTYGLSGYGWFVLLMAVLFPLVAFAIAFALGWKRLWWEFAFVLLTGLALTAVFWLNVLAFSAFSDAMLAS